MPSINPVDNYNFGIFGLNDVRTSIVTVVPTAVVGIATTTNVNTRSFVDVTNWSQDSSHGWFGGGFVTSVSSRVSTVDRIDFSNDSATVSVRGLLSGEKDATAATGNSNYGWFGGGNAGAIPTVLFSTVDRIDFSNDSATASLRGPLSLAKTNLAATGNSNYGWFGGGEDASFAYVSTVDRIDFSNDSATASVRGSLSRSSFDRDSTGNSDYGWFGGGLFTVELSIVDRIDFSNDSSAALPRSPLSSARRGPLSTGNSNYGWFGGGNTSPSPVTTVDRIDFSNDSSTASVRGPLSSGRYVGAATGNSNYGWFGGGQFPRTSRVERIDFSNDSVTASVRGPLSGEKSASAATSGQAKSSSIRPPKGGNFGWFGGGNAIPSFTPISTVNRIDFSNDSSTASVKGPLSLAKRYLAATGNSNYGWFGGGNIGVTPQSITISTVDRIDFSNDSATASIRGPLSSAKDNLSATGNSNYGWFGGGDVSGSSRSTVDRIDFSNDSSRASVRGSLSSVRRNPSATGNSNYGWFGGNLNPTQSIVDRIDFSNDSATASVRGPLSVTKGGLSATGNSNYGWFGGGFPTTSTVERIDFSNDSATASIRGPLSIARRDMGATGNSNYGWFGGGSTGTLVSTVERIDFSNDSSTASVRGPFNNVQDSAEATSNTPIG